MKKHIVKLTQKERDFLSGLISTGKSAAKKILHARILFKVDSGPHGEHWTDEKVSEALDVSVRSIERIRERFVLEDLESALERRKHKRYRPRRLDGKKEAHLVALACSQAPEGRKRWTLHLLADKMVEMKHVESLSHEAVRQTLKKMKLSLG